MFADRWNRHIRLLPHDRLFARTLLPFIPKRVHPNHITVFRMLMTPVLLWVLLAEWYAMGVPLFLFLGLTDALDGSLARVRKQITECGILFDPVADKLLIGSVLFIVVLHHINFALGIALLITEAVLIVGGMWRKLQGRIEPANVWGKIKMVAEVIGILFLLIALWSGQVLFVEISAATLALALVVAIMSVFSKMV